MAPPTSPRPLARRASRWPKGLGVTAIVIGALGVLMHTWSVLSLYIMQAFSMPGQAGIFKAMAEYRGRMTVGGVLAGACSIVLLIAGIGILRRRRWSVKLVLFWAAAKILVVPYSAIVAYLMQIAQFRAMANDPAFRVGGASVAGFGDNMALGTAIFTVCWGWALPIFVIVWFMRKRVRQETAGWR